MVVQGGTARFSYFCSLSSISVGARDVTQQLVIEGPVVSGNNDDSVGMVPRLRWVLPV